MKNDSIVGDDLGLGDGSRNIAYSLEINNGAYDVVIAVPNENVVITGWS